MNIDQLANHIDHTVLQPDARQVDIERACQVARELGCVAVCVNSIHVALASRLLVGSPVLVVGVVGFPFGATYTAVKVLETELAVQDGADEIDMVVAIGRLKDDENETWTVTLYAGNSYRIAGVCDGDCKDIDLALLDGNRNELTSDMLADDVPILDFTPKTTGSYTIKVMMPTCNQDPCYFGLGIFFK